MKRKLLVLIVGCAVAIGYCQPRYCYIGRCQLEQQQVTVVRVNNQPHLIVGK